MKNNFNAGIISFLTFFLCTALSSQQGFVVADMTTSESLPFANCVSHDSTFFTYGNADGFVSFPKNVKATISYLGYLSYTLDTDQSIADTIFLRSIESSLDQVTIVGERINLWNEIESLRKKYSKKSKQKRINTLTKFETVHAEKIIERALIISQDLANQKNGFTFLKRIHVDYSYDIKSPFLSIDIDSAIKGISLFGKSKIASNHLFNNGKINKRKLNLSY